MNKKGIGLQGLGNKGNKGYTIGSPAEMNTPLYRKLTASCKSAAKSKFKVWPSAYASGWGVRCTKAGGPGKFGKKKK
jgi:hypothetical protein